MFCGSSSVALDVVLELEDAPDVAPPPEWVVVRLMVVLLTALD